ncbi:DMT family transporter [Millisia brevis]|uniref:DMT family transporter n=1 Tax=Millisia brevis TaxID=264148 RepID=UPI000A00146F|nr:DMT family transporter [Millisia brevis]
MKPLQLWLMTVAFVAIWTSGYLVGSLGTRYVAPEALVFWRFLIAAAVMAGIGVWRGMSWPQGWDALRYVGIGTIFFGLQFGALFYGMSVGVPAATTALIACSAPLVVAVLSSGLGWERLGPRRWVGIGIGVLGVAITLADRVGRPPHAIDLVWPLLGLTGLAVGTLLHGRMRTGHPGPTIGALEIVGGILPIAILAPLTGTLTLEAAPVEIGALLWLALIAGVVAPLMMFVLIRERGAVGTSSLLFVVPALTALAAWPTLGQPFGPTALIGFAVAGAGLLLALHPAPEAGAAPATAGSGSLGSAGWLAGSPNRAGRAEP